LYEMATGMLAFRGESSGVIFEAILNRNPAPPLRLNPDLPLKLEDIIHRALEKDCSLRYQHAADIRSELLRLKRDLDSGKTNAKVSEETEVASSGRVATISSGPRTAELTPQPVSHDTTRSLARKSWLFCGGAVVATVLIAFAFNLGGLRARLFRNSSGPPKHIEGLPSLQQGKYVAVLPFRVLGDRASLSYVADGIAEALSTKLFRVPGVHVVVPTKELDLSQSNESLARVLGVNLLVIGTIQGTPENMRVIVNLENVGDGQRLWSGEFSGISQNLLGLEDDVYAKVVTAIENGTTLQPSNSPHHPTENVEAYDLYLRGREIMHNEVTTEKIEAALRL